MAIFCFANIYKLSVILCILAIISIDFHLTFSYNPLFAVKRPKHYRKIPYLQTVLHLSAISPTKKSDTDYIEPQKLSNNNSYSNHKHIVRSPQNSVNILRSLIRTGRTWTSLSHDKRLNLLQGMLTQDHGLLMYDRRWCIQLLNTLLQFGFSFQSSSLSIPAKVNNNNNNNDNTTMSLSDMSISVISKAMQCIYEDLLAVPRQRLISAEEGKTFTLLLHILYKMKISNDLLPVKVLNLLFATIEHLAFIMNPYQVRVVVWSLGSIGYTLHDLRSFGSVKETLFMMIQREAPLMSEAQDIFYFMRGLAQLEVDKDRDLPQKIQVIIMNILRDRYQILKGYDIAAFVHSLAVMNFTYVDIPSASLASMYKAILIMLQDHHSPESSNAAGGSLGDAKVSLLLWSLGKLQAIWQQPQPLSDGAKDSDASSNSYLPEIIRQQFIIILTQRFLFFDEIQTVSSLIGLGNMHTPYHTLPTAFVHVMNEKLPAIFLSSKLKPIELANLLVALNMMGIIHHGGRQAMQLFPTNKVRSMLTDEVWTAIMESLLQQAPAFESASLLTKVLSSFAGMGVTLTAIPPLLVDCLLNDLLINRFLTSLTAREVSGVLWAITKLGLGLAADHPHSGSNSSSGYSSVCDQLIEERVLTLMTEFDEDTLPMVIRMLGTHHYRFSSSIPSEIQAVVIAKMTSYLQRNALPIDRISSLLMGLAEMSFTIKDHMTSAMMSALLATLQARLVPAPGKVYDQEMNNMKYSLSVMSFDYSYEEGEVEKDGKEKGMGEEKSKYTSFVMIQELLIQHSIKNNELFLLTNTADSTNNQQKSRSSSSFVYQRDERFKNYQDHLSQTAIHIATLKASSASYRLLLLKYPAYEQGYKEQSTYLQQLLHQQESSSAKQQDQQQQPSITTSSAAHLLVANVLSSILNNNHQLTGQGEIDVCLDEQQQPQQPVFHLVNEFSAFYGEVFPVDIAIYHQERGLIALVEVDGEHHYDRDGYLLRSYQLKEHLYRSVLPSHQVVGYYHLPTFDRNARYQLLPKEEYGKRIIYAATHLAYQIQQDCWQNNVTTDHHSSTVK